MSFVKLDTGILDSTLWIDREARDVFITALLMSEPREFKEPVPQLAVRSIEPTGWSAPAGWYGFVGAAGSGIVRRAQLPAKAGLDALERLGNPEPESRSPTFEGRRMIRTDGGYLVLNFMRYRDYDHSARDRMKALRARRKAAPADKPSESVTRNNRNVRPNVTHSRGQMQSQIADAESDADSSATFAPFWHAYPNKKGKGDAEKAWKQMGCAALAVRIMAKLEEAKQSHDWTKERGQFIPHPATWIRRKGWEDEFKQNGKAGEYALRGNGPEIFDPMKDGN